MTGFAAVDVIIAKRDRRELTGEQIRWVIDAYTAGEVAEEQMSALLMAILLNGMTAAEIANWTTAMLHSGIIPPGAELSSDPRRGRLTANLFVQGR